MAAQVLTDRLRLDEVRIIYQVPRLGPPHTRSPDDEGSTDVATHFASSTTATREAWGGARV